MRPAWAGVARFAFALCLLVAGGARAAAADPQIYEGLSAPIVRVNVREGSVEIRTWNRDAVSVDGDPSLVVERRTANGSGESVPLAMPQLNTPDGGATLPPESFVTGDIPAGPRTVVVIHSGPTTPRAPVTVMIPSDSAFVYARAGNGSLDVSDYRAGTLVAITRVGRMTLTNIGGTVFAQTFRGPIVVRNSSFDRIRARSLFGNVTFEHCNVRQIEATTLSGSIVYDDGSFAPGLARFESTGGNVAIGATGSVQYGARAASDSRVYTNFSGHAEVDARDGTTDAIVGSGGPVVTASSQNGNVFLYDGSLRGRAQLPPEWQPAVDTLARPATKSIDRRPVHAPQLRPFRRFPRREGYQRER
jgi:hypothetical protein